MKKVRLFFSMAVVLATGFAFQSCLDDDDNDYASLYPNALVTVCPQTDGSFFMNLDENTRLHPVNVKTSPFGNKEVRALLNFSAEKHAENATDINVHVNRLDSIRTKLPVVTTGTEDDEKFGNDPIEIVKDWVTVAEDGYLTLRLRTGWGNTQTVHFINLVTGINPENPYEFELRHDANGDRPLREADVLIAFNLNQLPAPADGKTKVKLRWNSYSGEKTLEFDLLMRPTARSIELPSDLKAASYIE